MNLRLELELMLRRYGLKLALILIVLVSALLVTLLRSVPWATTPVVVEATDGSRQLEINHRAFRTLLLPRGEIEVRQADLLETAARHGLTVGQLDYGQENRVAGQFGLATLQLPLRGSYPDLRAFLAAMLAAHPALAVEDLAIQRDPMSPTGNGVEARLKLAFFTEATTESRR
jgi:Tfp pilus assembly protein PilO